MLHNTAPASSAGSQCVLPHSLLQSASASSCCLLFTLKFLPQFFKISYCCYKRTKHFIFALQFTIPFSSPALNTSTEDNILKFHPKQVLPRHQHSDLYVSLHLGCHQIIHLLTSVNISGNPFNNSGLDFRKQLIVFRTSFMRTFQC